MLYSFPITFPLYYRASSLTLCGYMAIMYVISSLYIGQETYINIDPFSGAAAAAARAHRV